MLTWAANIEVGHSNLYSGYVKLGQHKHLLKHATHAQFVPTTTESSVASSLAST